MLSIGLTMAASPLWAAEPLVGLWRLQRQEINGTAAEFEPLALQVSQSCSGSVAVRIFRALCLTSIS